MAIVHDGKELEKLREIYPEIPENVIGLKITLGVDSVTQIECTFNPISTEQKNASVFTPSMFSSGKSDLNYGETCSWSIKEKASIDEE